MTNSQNIKKHIRKWVEINGKIDSALGDIVIDKLLGEGGTALVFEAKFAGKVVAIKFLGETVFPPQSTRYKRFVNEYVNLVRLVSTGIVVPLYHFGIQDMGEDMHVPYIVMERCDKTLHEQYQEDKLCDVDEFKRLFERLLTILETIHSAGIVHRDIKPKNILQRPNGNWVLGDFGIAWFDPEFYIKTAKTKKGDRLANWGFSAPEQLRRNAYDKATPCMDLYALGQTLYYCVSGRCIAGTNYRRFSQIAPSLSDYDSLIDKLVRQEPLERFQSVSEVRQFLDEREPGKRAQRHFGELLGQVRDFDSRLCRSTPKVTSGYAQVKDRQDINRVLTCIAKDCKTYNLRWTTGDSGGPAFPMKQWAEDIWLIDGHECKIVDMWIYRDTTIERQYVLVHLAARPPFGVYEYNDNCLLESEEAGYFEGKYVTSAELYNGYAMIDGESVKLVDAEVRLRNRKDNFFILAPQASVYVYAIPQTEHQIRAVIHSLKEAGKVSRSALEPLKRINRLWWQ